MPEMTKVKKKEKKSKKEKKRKKKAAKPAVDISTAPSRVSSNDISVATAPNISPWSAVFSTAAAVKPVTLGGYREPIMGDDALGVSSLAREYLVRKSGEERTEDPSPCDRSTKRRKLEKEDEQQLGAVSPTEDPQLEPHTLEGRMLEYQGESILGLVDKEKKIVYSGVERTKSGDMIPIASIEENGTLSFFNKGTSKTQTAFAGIEADLVVNLVFPS